MRNHKEHYIGEKAIAREPRGLSSILDSDKSTWPSASHLNTQSEFQSDLFYKIGKMNLLKTHCGHKH